MPFSKKSILKRITQTENYQVNWREMFLQVKNLTCSLASREVHMASLWGASLLRGLGVTPLRSATSACQIAERAAQGPLKWKGRPCVPRARDTAATRIRIEWLNLETKLYFHCFRGGIMRGACATLDLLACTWSFCGVCREFSKKRFPVWRY